MDVQNTSARLAQLRAGEQGMGRAQVLVVAGTHGNERNAPALLERWRSEPQALHRSGLPVALVMGNPAAHQANRRYIDRDLNRCFAPDLLDNPELQPLELQRARELLAEFAPQGSNPCAVAIDLHSTTSGMGNSLVVYGRRPSRRRPDSRSTAPAPGR